MANFVFYDLETSDSALNFSQILEASFIICNDNLEELKRATFFEAVLRKSLFRDFGPNVQKISFFIKLNL